MTVAMTDGVLRISDVCNAEDAEEVANRLQEGVASVDLTECRHLHTAAFQLLLAAGLKVAGPTANPLLTRWVLPLLDAWPAGEADAATVQFHIRSTE